LVCGGWSALAIMATAGNAAAQARRAWGVRCRKDTSSRRYRQQPRSAKESMSEDNPYHDSGCRDSEIEQCARNAKRMNQRNQPVMKIVPTPGICNHSRKMSGVSWPLARLTKTAVTTRHAGRLEAHRIIVPYVAVASSSMHGLRCGLTPRTSAARAHAFCWQFTSHAGAAYGEAAGWQSRSPSRNRGRRADAATI
jgi:hypothetical protein